MLLSTAADGNTSILLNESEQRKRVAIGVTGDDEVLIGSLMRKVKSSGRNRSK